MVTFWASSVPQGSGLGDIEGILNADFTGVQRFYFPQRVLYAKTVRNSELRGPQSHRGHGSHMQRYTLKCSELLDYLTAATSEKGQKKQEKQWDLLAL